MSSSNKDSDRTLQRVQWFGRAAVVVVVVAVGVLLGYYLVLGLSWSGQLQLSSLVGHTQVIDVAPLVVSTPWDGTYAGFDTLVKLDSTALPTDPRAAQAAIREVVASYEPGERLTATVRRLETGHVPETYVCEPPASDDATSLSCHFEIQVGYFPVGAFATWFVVPYLVGVGLIAIGAGLLWVRRHQGLAYLIALICAAMALSVAGVFDLYSTYTLSRVWPLALALTGGGLGVLALSFPNVPQEVRRLPWLRWLPAAPAALVALYAELALYGPEVRAYYYGWLACLILVGLNLVFFMAMMLWRRRRTTSYAVREQASMAFVGSVLAFSPVLLLGLSFVLEWLLHVPHLPFSMAGVMPWLLAFPGALVYGLLRHHRLDTDHIIRQGTVYGVLGVAVILGYASLIAGLTVMFGDIFKANNPMAVALVVTVVAFLLAPVRSRLEKLIDQVYFRTRHSYQTHLEELGRTLTQTVDIQDVVEVIRETLEKVLLPRHIYIYMLDQDTNQYSNPKGKNDIRFDLKSGITAVLAQKNLFYLQSDAETPPELIGDVARLRVLQTVLLAGLRAKRRNQLAGFVALAPKKSGKPYMYEDLRFVEGLVEQASMAVERSQVISDLERRVSDLDALTRVAQAVNFTIEFDDLLELVYAQTNRVIDASHFFIALHDPKAEELYYAFYSQHDQRIMERENRRWRVGRGLVSEVVRLGQPIRTDDYTTECAKRDIRPQEQGLYAWMGVPLNAGTSVLGALAVASDVPGFVYTDEQIKVFWAIADAAATAIEKSRLFTETEKRAEQLAALNKISNRLVAQVLNVEELLQQIMSAAVEILRAETGSLLLVADQETGDLVFRVATGSNSEQLIGTRLPRGTGVVGTVAERGESVIVNDVRHDPRWFGGMDENIDFETKAVLAVPLVAYNNVIGVLEVINKQSGSVFTEEDEQLLTTFAAQAAIAIENARLFQQTDEELSRRVDELQMLAMIDQELNTTLDIHQVGEITVRWALRITGADAGMLGSMRDGEEEDEGLHVLAHYGYRQEVSDKLNKPLPADWGIAGRVIRTGQAELVTRVGLDPDYYPISPDTRVEMAVPLRSGGEVLGVIVLDSFSASGLSLADVDFVSRLAEHASPAITNARLYADLKAANESKSEFVGMVWHELNTPMTSIRGYTDMLVRGQLGDLSAMQHQSIEKVHANVNRMLTLINDLRDVTKIEAGQIDMHIETIRLDTVADEALFSTQNLIEGKNQNLQVMVPDDLPTIRGDRVRLVQVLTNLLSNANKYTQEGGTITLGAEAANNIWDKDGPDQMMHIYVRDNGIGMSPEDQEHLFEKFFRSTNPEALDMPGTGLGLSITRRVIELHGGTIWVESDLGTGSTFHFTVPLAAAV